MDIYRTVYEIEIFSRGPFVIPYYGGDAFDDPVDLLAINEAIIDGECIGAVHRQNEAVVAPDDVVPELQRIGNDGTFFEGEDVDDDEADELPFYLESRDRRRLRPVVETPPL